MKTEKNSENDLITPELLDKLKDLNGLGLIPSVSGFISEAIIEKLERLKKSKRKRFQPPSYEDVAHYMSSFLSQKFQHMSEQQHSNAVEFCKNESLKFVNFYESKNWYVGKNKMSKWKNACTNWLIRAMEDKQRSTQNQQKNTIKDEFKQTDFYKNL